VLLEGRDFVAGFATVMLLSDYLPTQGGGVLKTVKDAYDYFEALPLHRASRAHWQDVSSAILQEAEVAQVTDKVKFALVLDDELDFDRLSTARWRLRDV